MAFRDKSSETESSGSSSLTCQEDLRNVFERDREELHWLAEAILGNRLAAEACVMDAMLRDDLAGYVAPAWRDLWIKRRVAQAAVKRAHREVEDIASSYPRNGSCGSFAFPLDAAQRQILRSLPAEKITETSNILECASLMMHGYLGFAICDCAVSMGCHPSIVEPACSNALRRIFELENKAQEVQDRPGLSGFVA